MLLELFCHFQDDKVCHLPIKLHRFLTQDLTGSNFFDDYYRFFHDLYFRRDLDLFSFVAICKKKMLAVWSSSLFQSSRTYWAGIMITNHLELNWIRYFPHCTYLTYVRQYFGVLGFFQWHNSTFYLWKCGRMACSLMTLKNSFLPIVVALDLSMNEQAQKLKQMFNNVFIAVSFRWTLKLTRKVGMIAYLQNMVRYVTEVSTWNVRQVQAYLNTLILNKWFVIESSVDIYVPIRVTAIRAGTNSTMFRSFIASVSAASCRLELLSQNAEPGLWRRLLSCLQVSDRLFCRFCTPEQRHGMSTEQWRRVMA